MDETQTSLLDEGCPSINGVSAKAVNIKLFFQIENLPGTDCFQDIHFLGREAFGIGMSFLLDPGFGFGGSGSG